MPAVNVAACTAGVLCNPNEPGTPFVGLLILWDSLRVLCVLGALAVIGRAIVVALQTPRLPTAQWWPYPALGLFCGVAVTTELVHFGDTPSYRLFAVAIVVGLTVRGCYRRRVRPRGESS